RATRRGAEHLLELVRSRDLQLVVAALARRLVGPPAQENRGVPKPVALQVVVLDFADPLDSQRLPRKIFAGAPSTLTARHSIHGGASIGPLAPRMIDQRMRSQRFELARERLPCLHRERRRHADVLQPSSIVVQTKEQRSDRVFAALMPAKAGDDA